MKNKIVPVTTWGLWLLALIMVAWVMLSEGLHGFDADKIGGALWYDILVLIPLIVLGGVHTVRCYRSQSKWYSIALIWVVLSVVGLVTVWCANFESSDWIHFLARWCSAYQGQSWADALRTITEVSDYTPFYNYYLIALTRVFDLQGCFYAVKYLSFLFSVAMAVVMELIICHVCQSKLNCFHIALFLLLPPVLWEFTAWGQCDVIYTMFCLWAFYWALKHRSVSCFICLGLAFVLKLQFLFIVPIIFIMLIIRDADGKKYLSWKWLWLAPCMYVVNLIPLLAGTPFGDLILIYFRQTAEYPSLSSRCANLPYLFNYLCFTDQPWVAPLAMTGFAIVGIAITLLLVWLVLATNRRQTLTAVDLVRYAVCFALVMVYFMPKMHGRFYFVAMALACVWAFVQPSRSNTLQVTLIIVGLMLPMFMYLAALDYNVLIYLGLMMNTVAIFNLVTILPTPLPQGKFDETNSSR